MPLHLQTNTMMITNGLLNWMVLSTALLGGWWLCYRLALRQERSFAYNRGFLVLGPLLAAGLPLLPLEQLVKWAPVAVAGPSIFSVVLPAGQVGPSGANAAGFDWLWALEVAYGLGMMLLLMRLLAGVAQLWYRTRSLPREQHAGYVLVHTRGQVPTSSFGRVVFWDETLPLNPAEAAQVLRHELAHVRQGHTYDRLLLEMLRALLWFNPFVHLCGRALALTHEFLADAAALDLGQKAGAAPMFSSVHPYTHLLARQVASRLGFSAPLAHSFSHSQTLNRIAMIQKTSPVRRWKQWLALPLASLLLLTVACERNVENLAPAPPPPPPSPAEVYGTPPPPPPIPLGQSDYGPGPDGAYVYVKNLPHLASGGYNEGIVAAIQKNIVYPTVAPANWITGPGRVFVTFVVDNEGQVQRVKILKGLAPEYDAAVIAAVNQLPRFVPGTLEDGKAVDVTFTFPVVFANKKIPSGQ